MLQHTPCSVNFVDFMTYTFKTDSNCPSWRDVSFRKFIIERVRCISCFALPEIRDKMAVTYANYVIKGVQIFYGIV